VSQQYPSTVQHSEANAVSDERTTKVDRFRRHLAVAIFDLKHFIVHLSEPNFRDCDLDPNRLLSSCPNSGLGLEHSMVDAKGYQEIALANGLVVGGHDRSYLDSAAFDDGVEGKSVLDIGTFHGRFCLEALKRGASRAVGLDVCEENLSIAKKLAFEAGLTPEYATTDFELWDTDETFDLVLGLNVLHHMYDPIHAIRKMMSMSRDKIVLEVAIPTLRNVLFSRGALVSLMARGPVITLGRAWAKAHVADYTFLLNPASLRVLFDMHSSAFEPIRIKPSPFKNRVIVEARKRRIAHLTVVAGPTAAGKSTFVERLLASKKLRQQLGIPEEVSAYAAAASVNTLPLGRQEHVVLHYDILHPYMRSLRSYGRDSVLSIFDSAERISFLTIMTARDQLQEQFHRRELENLSLLRKVLPVLRRRTERIYNDYAGNSFLRGWYRFWFEYCATKSRGRLARNLIVENNRSGYVYHAGEHWRQMVDQHFPGTP
jgi:2-polyprenyl-3-methyl-5-hydroxy-6-metoxy-1,4-benzoquinol methylase